MGIIDINKNKKRLFIVNSDIILEILRIIITGGLVYVMVSKGNEEKVHGHKGWKLIKYGFILIFIGDILDLSDNFESLNHFVVIGDTAVEAFLEKFVCFSMGFFLIFLGFLYWLPEIKKLSEIEEALRKSNKNLKRKITSEANKITKDLTEDIKDRAFLQDMVLSVDNDMTEDEIIQLCLKKVCQHINWSIAHIHIYNDENSKLETSNLWYSERKNNFKKFRNETMKLSFENNEDIISAVFNKKSIIWLDSYDKKNKDISKYLRLETAKKSKLKTILAVPVLYKSNPIAVLELLSVNKVKKSDRIYNIAIHTANIIGQMLERKRYQGKLLKSKQVAELANENKTNFLAHISHEIRTPMNGIMGMAKLMSSTKLNKEQNKYITAINKSGQALLDIVNNLLDISKIEAGKSDIFIETFSLKNNVENLITLLTPNAFSKGISLNYKLDKEATEYLIGDLGKLRQILLNLINNAIKFTNEGSVNLNITTKSIVNNKAKILFEIIDTGMGISKKNKETIFKKFNQGKLDTNNKYGGTGLGLTICTEILKLLGSDIQLSSKLRKGSNFSFILEFEISGYHNKIIEVKPEKLAITNKYKSNILVVEDNEINIQLLEYLLGKNKFITLEVARNGKEALDKVKSSDFNFDMILMDVIMPIMNGITATKKIRKLTGSKGKLPIIAMTAETMKKDKEKCLSAGMDYYISKPIELNTLLKLIANIQEDKYNKNKNIKSISK